VSELAQFADLLHASASMSETSATENVDPGSQRDPFGMLTLKAIIFSLVGCGVGWLAYFAKLGQVPSIIVALAVAGVGLYAALKLAGSPRELWFTFSLKLFSVTAYKLITVVLVSYLMKDCGVKDSQAQWLFGIWGMFMSISTLLSGSLTDALGLRRTLLIGLTLCLVTRVVMIVSSNTWVVLGCGLIPLAIGEALCTPVLVAATRRYTSTTQRSVAFSVFYAILNLGFMFAYFVRDAVQSSIGSGVGSLLLAGGAMSTQRILFLVSLGVELLAVPFVLMLRDNQGGVTVAGSNWLGTVKNAADDTFRLFGALFRHKAFHRLLFFLLLIGLLKIVFNIMDAVLPTFAEREIGVEGAGRVGRLNAVNSILIMILAPAVGVLTRKFSAYSMVVFGGFITALSFVFMVMPAEMFVGMAHGGLGEWFGRGYLEIKGVVHPYLIMILFWQIAFSIGEAFYSPRVYEYAVAIAPAGQEASYASLSAVPLLMGKLINSAAFAGLLTAFCPATGPRDPGKMWMLIGLLVLMSPLLLLLLRSFIRVKEEGRE